MAYGPNVMVHVVLKVLGLCEKGSNLLFLGGWRTVLSTPYSACTVFQQRRAQSCCLEGVTRANGQTGFGPLTFWFRGPKIRRIPDSVVGRLLVFMSSTLTREVNDGT